MLNRKKLKLKLKVGDHILLISLDTRDCLFYKHKEYFNNKLFEVIWMDESKMNAAFRFINSCDLEEYKTFCKKEIPNKFLFYNNMNFQYKKVLSE